MSQSQPTTRNRFEIDPFKIGRLLLKKRKWIVGIVLPICLLTALKLILTPNVYQSSAVILPSGGGSELSGIKELVGLGGGNISVDENSSALYPLILKSNLVRDSLLNKTYAIQVDGEAKTVGMAEYFGQEDRNLLRESLGDITGVSANKRTGEILITVETEYPAFSRALAAEYIAQLENYNRFTRKSSARENERYLQQRLGEADIELTTAENALKEFRSANSNWAMTTNAEILTESSRLERDVSLRTTSKMFLEKQLEMARLEAQKDIPIVRVLDRPNLPTLKSGPNRTLTLLAVGFLSTLLVMIAIIVIDAFRAGTDRSKGSSFTELREDCASTFPRTSRALNLVKRRVRSLETIGDDR